MVFFKYFFFVFILIFMIPIVLVIQIETVIMTTVLNENYYISTFKYINLYEKIAASLLEEIELELNTEITETASAEFIENISSALDNLARRNLRTK